MNQYTTTMSNTTLSPTHMPSPFDEKNKKRKWKPYQQMTQAEKRRSYIKEKEKEKMKNVISFIHYRIYAINQNS